jgi:hypothetical protein
LPILFAEQMPSHADEHLENAQRVRAAMAAMRSLPNVFVAVDRTELVTVLGRVAEPNVRFHGEALSVYSEADREVDRVLSAQ